MNMRRTKIFRDLWANKSRTLLVILSIAVGVAAFGLMITGRIVLERNLAAEFAASTPAHSVLVVSPFGDELLDKVRTLPDVQTAEGRHVMQARIEITPDHWLSLDLHGIENFSNITVSQLKRIDGGSLPPPLGAILLERSIADVAKISVGQKVRIQTLDGKTSEVEVAGFVNDLASQPTPISLIAYGYATLPILEAFGEATTFNRLY